MRALSRVNDLWHRKDRTRTARYGTGKRWQAVWTDGAGREVKSSHTTKDAARAWILARETTGAIRERVTVAEYAERWQERQVHQRKSSRGTIETRVRRNIIPVLGEKWMHEVTRADVQDAVIQWRSVHQLAPSTVGLTYTYLSGIFTEAALDGVVEKSPCVRIRLPADSKGRVEPLTVAQVQQIESKLWRPYRPALVVAAATGMRPGEWRGLTVDRVDLETGMITVDRQLVGGQFHPQFGPLKTEWSYRRIKVGESTLEVLAWLAEDPGPEGVLFHSAGRAMDRGMLYESWADAREKLPSIGPGWHQLRHHHASVLLSQGASVVAVARRLGHKDGTETLRTYGHLMPEDDPRMVSLSDGLVRWNRHESATEPPPSA